MRLRNRVREAREARGLTQVRLCELAGLSRMTLRQIERDDGHQPTGWVMTALSKTLEDAGLFWWERHEAPVTAAS